jgi:hypothetical protein
LNVTGPVAPGNVAVAESAALDAPRVVQPAAGLVGS